MITWRVILWVWWVCTAQCSRCLNWATGQISVWLSWKQDYNKKYTRFLANDDLPYELLLCRVSEQGAKQHHIVTSTSDEVSEDCPLFLRLLTSRVIIDNQSTISYYSHQLTCVNQLMIKVNNDITTFNDKVRNIMYQLQSHGESIQHLMVNILKGYEATTDKEFVTNCCFVHSAAGYNDHQEFMSMFPLEGDPSCFMGHYGLMATEEELNMDKHIQSPDIRGRISIDLPKGVSPFETKQSRQNVKIHWQAA